MAMCNCLFPSARKIVWCPLPSLFLLSCSERKPRKTYFNDLGEIPFNEHLDDPNFNVCHKNITFPFNYGGVGLVYEGEKRALMNAVRNPFDFPKTQGQNGFITVRFPINREGRAGRFRVTEIGLDLKPKKFDKTIEVPGALTNICITEDEHKTVFINYHTQSCL